MDRHAACRTVITPGFRIYLGRQDASSHWDKAFVFFRTTLHGRHWSPSMINTERPAFATGKLYEPRSGMRILAVLRLRDEIGPMSCAIFTRVNPTRYGVRNRAGAVWRCLRGRSGTRAGSELRIWHHLPPTIYPGKSSSRMTTMSIRRNLGLSMEGDLHPGRTSS